MPNKLHKHYVAAKILLCVMVLNVMTRHQPNSLGEMRDFMVQF